MVFGNLFFEKNDFDQNLIQNLQQWAFGNC